MVDSLRILGAPSAIAPQDIDWVRTIGAVIAGIIALLPLIYAAVRLMRYVLTSWHNETVRPVISDLTKAIEVSTATAASVSDSNKVLASALDEVNRTQRASQERTGQALEGIREILGDLHTRVKVIETVLEIPDTAATARTRQRKRGA